MQLHCIKRCENAAIPSLEENQPTNSCYGSDFHGGNTGSNPVWYWFDGTDVFVASYSRNRKARNLQANPQVSLMIDVREPAASYGATIEGSAQIFTGESSQKYNAEVHRKYPSEATLADRRVGPVLVAWDDVTVRLAPVSVIAWDL